MVLALGGTRVAFVEACLTESGLVAAGGRGLAGLEGASGHGREKEADEKTI